MPGWLRERGLDAYEYQCGKGVTVGGGHCPGHWAGRCSGGGALSLHAPYFVNPANPEPDSQAKTAGYVLAACRVARWMGADRVVVHTGAIQKRTRQAALGHRGSASERCGTCDEEGDQDILLCPETMGKINQLGDLEEVLTPLHGGGGACCPAWTLATCSLLPGGVGRPEAVERMLDQMVGELGVARPASFTAIFPRLPIRPGGRARHNL